MLLVLNITVMYCGPALVYLTMSFNPHMILDGVNVAHGCGPVCLGWQQTDPYCYQPTSFAGFPGHHVRCSTLIKQTTSSALCNVTLASRQQGK